MKNPFKPTPQPAELTPVEQHARAKQNWANAQSRLTELERECQAIAMRWAIHPLEPGNDLTAAKDAVERQIQTVELLRIATEGYAQARAKFIADQQAATRAHIVEKVLRLCKDREAVAERLTQHITDAVKAWRELQDISDAMFCMLPSPDNDLARIARLDKGSLTDLLNAEVVRQGYVAQAYGRSQPAHASWPVATIANLEWRQAPERAYKLIDEIRAGGSYLERALKGDTLRPVPPKVSRSERLPKVEAPKVSRSEPVQDPVISPINEPERRPPPVDPASAKLSNIRPAV